MTSRTFVCGVTTSGKSEFVRREILPAVSRAIIVDPIGDYPADAKLFSVRDTLLQVREYVTRGFTDWHIVASLDRTEIGALVDALVPRKNAYGSFVRAVGGLTVVLEECDLLTPRGQHGEQIASLFRRGRHVQLSAVAVTQRPANVSKEVIAQADVVVAYRLHDPADVAYISARCGPGAAECMRQAWASSRYGAMIWENGGLGILNPDYTVTDFRADKPGGLFDAPS